MAIPNKDFDVRYNVNEIKLLIKELKDLEGLIFELLDYLNAVHAMPYDDNYHGQLLQVSINKFRSKYLKEKR